MKIAIIPARGGSKRIPHKNIKLFCGKPMIAWSIEAARAARIFDHIIVSTDDDNIAKIANKYGAKTPFSRPPHLSDDYTGTAAVVKHALGWVLENLGVVKHVCTIYATAPFLESNDIIDGFKLLTKRECEMTIAVTSFPFPIQRAIKLSMDGAVSMFEPTNFIKRSQDLEPSYHDAGQLYWATTEAVMNDQSAFTPIARAQVLPRHKVQDIDTIEDWTRAELMFMAWHAKTK